jgi:galactokinase
MIESALSAGALGAKIVGSGGGGCIVAIATPENEQEVINAILKAGAIDAFSAQITAGAKIKNYE